MARRLELDISADSKDAGAALALAARNVDHLARETDRLQREFKQAERAAEGLDRQLLQTKAATAALAAEFSKTGDAGIKKKLDAERVAAKELQKLRADIIGDTEKDAKAAERAWQKAANEYKRLMRKSGNDSADTFAQFFEGGILKALSNPHIAAAAGVAAVALAVEIGAVVGGAVTAGAALGAVGIGVAGAASQSKAVGDAWSQEIERIQRQWMAASQPFIGPTIKAAHEFGDAISSINLDKILGKAAGYFDKLVSAAGTFVRYVGAGFESLVEDAQPVIDVLAKELPDLGLAFQMFFEDIGQGSEGGASALKDLLDVIEGVIIGTGRFIHLAENAYDALKRFSEGASDFVQKAASFDPLLAPAAAASRLFADDADKAERFGAALTGVTGTAMDFGDAATTAFYNTADAARELSDAIDRLFNEAMNLDEANLAVKEGQLKLIETLKENGRTLDENSQKGIDNRQAILAQIEALNRQREAAIAAGSGTKEAADAANAAYARQLAGLRQLLVELGYPPAKIDAIIKKYEQLANLGNITKTFTVQYRQSGTPLRGFSRYPGEASGTPSAMPGLTWVGEKGPELVDFNGGERVYNATESARIAANYATSRMTGAGAWGGGAPVINVYVAGSVLTARQLVEEIETTVSRLGGSPELLGIKAA